MDLSKYEAAASASPPSAPASPSTGYPTNGNPASAIAATKPGDYWYYQMQAEIAALLGDANITPSHTALTQMRDALRALGLVRPVEALPYPTICNATNKLTVTPASATNGGTVSIPADTWVELCEEISAGETGRIRSAKTPAYTTEDLDVSSTYFIRARMSNGAISFYKQKGTDGDSGWSQSWTGTPDGTSGGGVDSSKLDLLVARVVTGVAGSIPTVTALANAAVLRLRSRVEYLDLGAGSSTPGWLTLASIAVNWARTPTAMAVLSGFSDSNSGWTVNGAGSVDAAAVKVSAATRYAVTAQAAVWDSDLSSVGIAVGYVLDA